VSIDTSKIKNNEVLLKVLAAPINPSDFNMVSISIYLFIRPIIFIIIHFIYQPFIFLCEQAEGTYGANKALPAIAGSEFAAKVMKVGSEVSSLKEGDWVVPHAGNIGKLIILYINNNYYHHHTPPPPNFHNKRSLLSIYILLLLFIFHRYLATRINCE